MNEDLRIYRIIGPPGTGKTTYSAAQAKIAVKKYGSEGVLLLSLTKAAAQEIGSRDTGVDEALCSTIHAQCYRLMNGTNVVLRKHVEEWNSYYPQWQISPSTMGTSSEKLSVGIVMGDELYGQVDLLRNKQIPKDDWTDEQRDFLSHWTEWLAENELTDFTGMLENVLTHKLKPRYSIGAIIADECQDFSTLELSVLYQWANFSEVLVMVGDLHQSLYSFRGANMKALEGDNHKVLSQSYRVPGAVHRVAQKLMERMGTIEPVEFRPKEGVEGSVEYSGVSFRRFEGLMPEVEDEIEQGRTTMILASCGYMLGSVIKMLRTRGIPFWNPFSSSNAGWNPLTPKLDRGSIATSQRFAAYLAGARGNWTIREFHMMTKLFSKCWVHGAKKMLAECYDNMSPAEVTKLLPKILKQEVWDDFYDFTTDPEKMSQWVVPNLESSFSYFCRVYERYGAEAFSKPPKVIVGTIHSVKGGEADTVILFPDLSKKWQETYEKPGWENRDSLLRLFYVGVTRAKDRLIIGSPSGKFYVPGL